MLTLKMVDAILSLDSRYEVYVKDGFVVGEIPGWFVTPWYLIARERWV